MRWNVPDLNVDQTGLGKRLCKMTVKIVNWTGRILWVVVDGGS